MVKRKRAIIIAFLIIILFILTIKISSAYISESRDLDFSNEDIIELGEVIGQFLGKEIEIKWVKINFVVRCSGEEEEFVFNVG